MAAALDAWALLQPTGSQPTVPSSMPELPEVEVVRAGLEPAVTGATRGIASRCSTSVRCAGTTGPPRTSSPGSTGATFAAAAPRQVHVAADPAVVDGAAAAEALVVHLGMSGQVLLREPDADDGRTRIRLELTHPAHGPTANRLRRPAHLRLDGDRRAGARRATARSERVPSQVAHIARDPLDPLFDDAAFLRRARARRTRRSSARCSTRPWSAASATSTPTRRCGRRACTTTSRPSGSARPRAKLLLAEVRLVLEQGARRGRHELRRPVRERQRALRLLLAVAERLRPAGLPCPRCGRPIVRESS